jgi:catechol 2,3-dioxygenase-like lactoylglutathione lyase family enzyme
LLEGEAYNLSTIVLWVSDLEAQSNFYASLFDVDAPTVQGDFVAISSDLNTVLLHLLPAEYAAQTPLTSQLSVNEEAAIKPVFTVDSIEAARARTSHTFASFRENLGQYGEYKYLDVIDPEGNVIQIQERS